MPYRSSGVLRAASEPTAEREPTAPEPDTRPTSYDNKFNWTTSAQAPMGATTAQNRLVALKAAAETDERIIRVRWSDPRTIAGLCVFIPLLFFDEFLAISRGFICASKNIELADLCSAVGVG
jgi:hypothetical protein